LTGVVVFVVIFSRLSLCVCGGALDAAVAVDMDPPRMFERANEDEDFRSGDFRMEERAWVCVDRRRFRVCCDIFCVCVLSLL